MRVPGDEVLDPDAADLQGSEEEAADAAKKPAQDSFEVVIDNMPIYANSDNSPVTYKFVFNYLYTDPNDEDGKSTLTGPPSATFFYDYLGTDLTVAPTNVVLKAGVGSYSVSWDKPTFDSYVDTVVYESATNTFTDSSTVVYIGTSNQATIITGNYTARYVKVEHRSFKYQKKSTIAGPVTPLTADPDTTFTVANPASSSATAVIDPKDLSGFSLVSTISWAASTNTKTAGYAIRWSTDNPSITPAPLWEYASVSGRTTTSYTATGLIPNTTYYYQVASTTPYDVVSWVSPASGTFIASDADGTAAGALARLKSFIAIGGASQDLFKLGTGISQGINLSTTPTTTPSLTNGTYHGLILNKSTTNVGNNFWLTTGQMRVGNSTEFLYWNGTDLYLTGNIEATGGKFTGNVQLAPPDATLSSGVLYAGASPTTGTRVRFSSEGLYGYDATGEAFSLTSSTGQITARRGSISGWAMDGTKLSSNNIAIDSLGEIRLGAAAANMLYLSSSNASWRMWAGNNTPDVNAKFRVSSTGVLYASGAEISGNLVITGGSTLSAINAKKSIFTGTSATATAVGDLWFDTNNNNRPKVWNGASWVDYRDSGITTAVNDAATALTTATGKNKTFVAATAPTNGTGANALKTGDMWIDTANGNVLKAWNGSSWNAYQDSSIATINQSLSTKLKASAYVIANASNEITGISGNGINIWSGATNAAGDGPATAGSRITLNSQGFQAYDTSGNPTVSILSGAGTASFSGNITAKSGQIGGFAIGTTVGDLTASTTPITGVYPRLIFGNKILLGWDSTNDLNYTFRIGNPYGGTTTSFRVNTITNVNRVQIDAGGDNTYALEVRNITRSVGFRYGSSGVVSDSARRFKENITPVPKHYYERILDVPINFYTYKDNIPDMPDYMWGHHSLGPIVDDMEEKGLGFFVERNLDGLPTSFRNEQKYLLLLVPIVKDLKEKVEQLENKILEMESK